jgi:hypothetical protein
MLRFAVNQQDGTAAAALVMHLATAPEQLLAALMKTQAAAQHVIAQQPQRQLQQQDGQQPEQQQLQHDLQQEPVQFKVLQHHSLQQQQVTPELLNELLLLAAKRQHYQVMLQLLNLSVPGPQQLPSSTLYSLLCSTVSMSAKNELEKNLVHKLRQLPAARVLDAAQVHSLLLAAVQQHKVFTLRCIRLLPGAAHLNRNQAQEVASAAVEGGRAESVKAITNVLNRLQPSTCCSCCSGRCCWPRLMGKACRSHGVTQQCVHTASPFLQAPGKAG